MITAQDIVTVLGENLEKIQNELGTEWPRFHSELVSLRQSFVNVHDDDNLLEIATDSVWDVCRSYPFIKGLVHGYSFSIQRIRKLPAGNFESKMVVHELANRFQSLFDKLEEIKPPDDKDQHERTRSEGRP